MFKNTLAKMVENQGERLINLEKENRNLKIEKAGLNRKCLDLQGQVDDCIDERIQDLKAIISHLTRNDYNNPRAKIAIALEYAEDKLKELSNT